MPGFPVGLVVAPTGDMQIDPSTFNDITHGILGAAIEVHRSLGPGLLESIYMPCLQFELTARNLSFVAQRPIPVVYKGIALETSYRIDLIVEEIVVVEVKSVAALTLVFDAQILNPAQYAGTLSRIYKKNLQELRVQLCNPKTIGFNLLGFH